jgi:hypothetical protein
VRRLVEADRKQEHDQLEQDVDVMQVHSMSAVILTDGIRSFWLSGRQSRVSQCRCNFLSMR